MSDVPTCCKPDTPVTLGIDEAGRGSILGPMTYGAAYWPTELAVEMEKKGFDDSKALTHETRAALFNNIENTNEVGYVVRVLQASEISRNMLRYPTPYNLNDMSHDTAMDMIRRVMAAGVKVTRCIIDTVGIPENYKRKLDSAFYGQGIEFVVEKKADANYKTVSAASIAAKVARDEITANWVFSEEHYVPQNGKEWNSGYPSDPKCKEWISSNLSDPVFGFPDVVRFSWAPTKKAIDEGAAKIKWEADDDEDDDQNQPSMANFLVPSENKKKRTRLGGFKVTKGMEMADLFSN